MTNLSTIRNAAIEDAGAGGLTVYASVDNLPTTGLTSGDQAYVTDTSRLYISNGSGWYNVALVNASPSLTISPSGAIELNTDGSTTTITLTATDSDYPDAALTYSVESDGSFSGLGTLSQDSSVFTITPLSEDSATTTSSTLTFKASDGISFGSGTSEISLRFSITNSKYTESLLKADASNNDDNQVDASTNSLSITEYGDVTSTAFTPYHPAGYSYYFDGSGDYIQFPDHNDLDFGSSDFTMECWVYVPDPSITVILMGKRANSSTFGATYIALVGGNAVSSATSNGSSWDMYGVNTSFGAVSANTWTHLALVRNGNNFTGYVNGVGTSLGTSSSAIAANSSAVTIGGDTDGYQLTGYIRDVRWVKGTAVYTSNFTPPTSALTAITNTQLLACHLPYIVDGSSLDHTPSTSGTPRAIRFSPYDYQNPYSISSHGGSVLFDGNGDYLDITTSTAADFGTGDFTVEVWWYPTTPTQNVVFIAGFTNATNTSNNVCEFYLGVSTGYLRPHINTNYSGTWTTRIETDKFCFDRTWNHVAYVRNGNVGNIYINGKKGPDTAINASAQFNNPFSALRLMTSRQTTTNFGVGHLQDMRIVKGTAVYTADFTPPTAPLTAITNTEVLTLTNKHDLFDAHKGARITSSGVTASTAQRKFTASDSFYFNGSNSYLQTNQANVAFGTNDFTIEAWVYMTSVSGAHNIYDGRNTGTQNIPVIYYNGGLYYHVAGSNRITGGTLSADTWYHIAVARSGTSTKMFVDGTQVGTTYSDSTSYVAGSGINVYWGNYSGNLGGDFIGYMQDMRVTHGLARYTANFTPPTATFEG